MHRVWPVLPLSHIACTVCGLCIVHMDELCKNGWTDRDEILGVDLRGPSEPCIRWESRPVVRYYDYIHTQTFLQFFTRAVYYILKYVLTTDHLPWSYSASVYRLLTSVGGVAMATLQWFWRHSVGVKTCLLRLLLLCLMMTWVCRGLSVCLSVCLSHWWIVM